MCPSTWSKQFIMTSFHENRNNFADKTGWLTTAIFLAFPSNKALDDLQVKSNDVRIDQL